MGNMGVGPGMGGPPSGPAAGPSVNMFSRKAGESLEITYVSTLCMFVCNCAKEHPCYRFKLSKNHLYTDQFNKAAATSTTFELS